MAAAAVLILVVAVIITAFHVISGGSAPSANVIDADDAVTEQIVRPEQTSAVTVPSESEVTLINEETQAPAAELTAAELTAAGETEVPSTSASRTVITSRQRKDYDNNSVYIDMENILQNPELPTGCEVTALTILLRHCGFNADKVDVARNYLPIGNRFRNEDGKTYKDSFFRYFIGDPFSRGYGCFSGAIEVAAEKYISENGGGFNVVNLSGSSPDVLYDYVSQGTPVLCWATDGMIEPEYYETWYDYDTGEQLDWYLNEHCFVLAGFNMDAGTVTLNDPMKGIIDYNIDRFETRYMQMFSQAIVLLPDAAEEETAATAATATDTENVTEYAPEAADMTEAEAELYDDET